MWLSLTMQTRLKELLEDLPDNYSWISDDHGDYYLEDILSEQSVHLCGMHRC